MIDCRNARAFTMRECKENRQYTRLKVILVSKNGKEEEVWPPIAREDPDGTYSIGSDGSLQQFEEENGESEEENLEQILVEEEQHSFIYRRSFHTTPRVKRSKGKYFAN